MHAYAHQGREGGGGGGGVGAELANTYPAPILPAGIIVTIHIWVTSSSTFMYRLHHEGEVSTT